MSLSYGRLRFVWVASIAVLAVLAALLTGTFITSTPAHAAVSGTGGEFVATSGRIASGTSVAANTWTTVQVAGQAGIPSDGSAGAVVINATVENMPGQGQLYGRPNSSTAASLMVTYDGASKGNTSDTSTIAIGSAGTIQVETNTTATLYLDVQGYYTTTGGGAGVAPGGFVSVPGTRIVDTRNGTGATQATIPSGSSLTVQVTGNGGVPAGASAVAANVLVVNASSTAGYVTPYTTGGTKPAESMHYVAGANVPTSDTAQVGLSSSGQMTIYNTGGTVNIVVDVQGYFTATDSGGTFTPSTGVGLYDSRNAPATTPAAGSTTVIQATGVASIPKTGSGVSAVAIQLTAINAPTTAGSAEVWADGAAKPATTSVNFNGDDIRSNTVIVALGSDGKFDLYTTTATDYQILVEGWYNALPTGPATTNMTGSRPSGTSLSFPIDDQTTTSVDVATGNLNVSNQGLTLPTLTGSATFGASYNSRGWEQENVDNIDANKWAYDLDSAGSLSANGNGIVYTAADGSTDQFTVNSDGSYTAASGIEATLTSSASGYTLTALTSRDKVAFNLSGLPTSVTDKNGNVASFHYSGFLLGSVVSNAGPAATASVSYSNTTTTISQANGSSTRSISYAKDSNGNITSYTDADGNTTTFAYSGTDLTSITSPNGGQTSFAYNSSDQVTSVTQPASTGSGTAVTRFSYASSTETDVASPDTSQSTAVASVPHTTYTINTNDLVTKTVNPDGITESSTYGTTSTTNTEVSNETVGATAGSESEENFTYGANNNQSLTGASSTDDSGDTGTSGSATYSASSEYQPASTTDGSGNSLYAGYDASGNQLTTSNSAPGSSSSSTTATATLAYNNSTSTYPYPGTVTSATNALGGKTTYTYNTNGQLASQTPPTDSSLKTKNYTYDAFGRLATETDGAGNTTTYTYDNDDRMLTEAFSDGTETVENVFDDNGNLTSQNSQGGSITNTYDPDNRLLTTQNTVGGGTISYAYDLSGNETSTADNKGTVTYTYDQANTLWAMTYPHGSGTETDRYAIDNHGRRTDSYVNAGAWPTAVTDAVVTTTSGTPAYTPASYTGHTQVSYTPASGHVAEIKAWTGKDASKVFDTTYSYGTSTAQKDKIQSATDNISGKVTSYGYNTDGRLTSANQTGGSKDWNWAYTYDVDGNRLTAVQTGAYTSNWILTYNDANQVTSSGYTYDGDGNLTATPGATYTYNGAEQMTRSVVGGTTTTYAYSGSSQDQVLTENSSSAGTYSFTYGKQTAEGTPEIDTLTSSSGTGRVLSDASDGQALDLSVSDGTTGAYLYDAENNQVGILADDNTEVYQATYDPYGTGGNTVLSDQQFYTQNPYGYVAGTTISDGESGALTKFGGRWYLANQGSWTQEDTLDAPLDPSSADRYAYAGDDPINDTDPAGSSDLSSALGIASTVLGAASVFATATGLGAPAALGLGVLSTAAEVGQRAVEGDTSGAVGAGLLGAATLGLGGAGEAFHAPDLVKTGVAAGYSGIEIGTSYLSN